MREHRNWAIGIEKRKFRIYFADNSFRQNRELLIVLVVKSERKRMDCAIETAFTTRMAFFWLLGLTSFMPMAGLSRLFVKMYHSAKQPSICRFLGRNYTQRRSLGS